MPESCSPSFSLFKIAGRSRNYYCQFKDPTTGKYLPYRSTGCPDKGSALLVVAGWLKDGVPEPTAPKARKPAAKKRRPVPELAEAASILKAARRAELTAEDAERIVEILKDRKLVDVELRRPGPADRDFIEYLAEFWDYKNSPYIREKIAHGLRVSPRRCYDAQGAVSHHWKPYFAGRSLGSISKQDMRSFSATLAAKGLACGSINKILTFGTCALSWAKENDILLSDPSEGLRKFSSKTEKRGILEQEEIDRLFTEASWPEDHRARVAALVAVTTGMRQGEIRAIKLEDIEDNSLKVFGWKNLEHRRAEPKSGETRSVPLLPQVKEALLELARENPHGQDGYVFYGIHPDAPCQPDVILNGLEIALESIGISREERLSRSVDFHSLRHAFTTYISRSVESGVLKAVTGHKTDSMFELYSGHKTSRDMATVAQAVAATFGSIVDPTKKPSKKKEAS